MRSRFSTLLLVLLATAGCCSGSASHAPEPKEIVDLSPRLTPSSACELIGRRTCDFLGIPPHDPFTPVVPADPNHSYGLMTFTLLSHAGAHLDAPGRLLRNGALADQVPLGRLYGPARLWDLRWHDRHTPLQITDLSQLPAVEPGEILLLFTGYTPPAPDDWPVYTWLSPQAASWLAHQHIRALATDMPSIDSFQQGAQLLDRNRPPEEVWAAHLPLFEAGIPVIEGLVHLDALEDQSRITFVGFPLAIPDRSGAPMRAVALVY